MCTSVYVYMNVCRSFACVCYACLCEFVVCVRVSVCVRGCAWVFVARQYPDFDPRAPQREHDFGDTPCSVFVFVYKCVRLCSCLCVCARARVCVYVRALMC